MGDEEGNVAKNRMLEASDMSPLKENTGDVPESNFGPGIKMLLGCCNPFAWPRTCCSGVKFLSNPSWIALAKACGCSDLEERPLRLSPSHIDCVCHGLKNLFDIMGASCGFFALAPLVYLIFCSQATSTGGAVVAAFLAALLTYISVFSIAADYWYTTDKPARKGSISDVQKQFICNYIDRINVPFYVLSAITIGCFQMYFQGLVVTMPCIIAAVGFAVFTQLWSLQQTKKYLDIVYTGKYDRENPDKKAIAYLKCGQYWHIIWHILSSGLAFSQIYLLCAYPHAIELSC